MVLGPGWDTAATGPKRNCNSFLNCGEENTENYYRTPVNSRNYTNMNEKPVRSDWNMNPVVYSNSNCHSVNSLAASYLFRKSNNQRNVKNPGMDGGGILEKLSTLVPGGSDTVMPFSLILPIGEQQYRQKSQSSKEGDDIQHVNYDNSCNWNSRAKRKMEFRKEEKATG